MLQRLRKFFPTNGHAENRHQPEPCEFTPDIWKLEQYRRQLIFVPDDMMTRRSNNWMVAEASHVGLPIHPTCYTHGPYTFWKKDLGEMSYPIILPDNYRPTGFTKWPVEPARVKGELWAIAPSQFILLDKHKQNGVQFRRERVKITLPYREVGWNKQAPNPKISDEYVHTVTAWMYVGVSEYWDSQIGGIFASAQVDPREHDVPKKWIKQFYRFE